MLAQLAISIAQVAKTAGLSRQTVCQIKDDPADAEAALGCLWIVAIVYRRRAARHRLSTPWFLVVRIDVVIARERARRWWRLRSSGGKSQG